MSRAVYQKINYLQNTVKGEVIDLEVPLADTIGFDVKILNLSTNGRNDIIGFGAKNGTTGIGIYFRNFYIATGSNYKSRIDFGQARVQDSSSYNQAVTGHTGKVINNANATSITVEAFSKTQTRTKAQTGTFNYSDISLYLFGLHVKSETQDYLETQHTGNVYYVKITNNGVLVRDMIPVKRLSDGMYGLLDLVSKKFFIAKSGNTTCFTGTVVANTYYDKNGDLLTEHETLIEELEYINETKELIKQALINKGVSVSDEDTFRSYADKIASI